MIAIYTRVSTDNQSVEPQLMELRHYAAARGWKIEHELSDTISGARDRRPGMDRLMELIRGRKIEMLIVTKIDRLARSLSHFARLVDELKTNKVALVIPGQGIDTSKNNPSGSLQLGILAVMAEFERSLISERTKAGLVVARANGKRIGNVSKKMPTDQAERIRILQEWVDAGRPGGFAGLGEKLGGVSRASAFVLYGRMAGRLAVPAEAPKVEDFDL